MNYLVAEWSQVSEYSVNFHLLSNVHVTADVAISLIFNHSKRRGHQNYSKQFGDWSHIEPHLNLVLWCATVKVPQILKIWRAGSSEGISIVGTSMELTAITGSMVYSYAKQFPFRYLLISMVHCWNGLKDSLKWALRIWLRNKVALFRLDFCWLKLVETF